MQPNQLLDEAISTNQQSSDAAFVKLNKLALLLINTKNFSIFENNNHKIGQALSISLEVLQNQLLNSEVLPNRYTKFVKCLFDPIATASNITNSWQRPSYIHYPELDQSPWLDDISAYSIDPKSFSKLQKEVKLLLSNNQTRPYFESESESQHSLAHLRNSYDWSTLIVQNNKMSIDLSTSPYLADYLQKIPLADCPPHAPEVMLSILKANTHITPHYGLSNLKLTLHLPIFVPTGDLGITAGGISKVWEEGVPIVFDDSCLHEAWNRGKSTRTVLICDVWHPDLSDIEKKLLNFAIPLIDKWQRAPFNSLFSFGLQYSM